MAKTGIYITGLGQSIHNETVEKYTERLRNELSFTKTGINYFLKTEKIFYQPDKDSTVVSLFKKDKNGNEELVYKIYDFQYHKILTEKFEHYNIFIKNLILFSLIIKKTPHIILRIFSKNGFSRPYQTTYAFSILLVISLCVLFLIPACIDLMTNESIIKNISKLLYHFGYDIDIEKIQDVGKYVLSITTLILLFAPQSKTIITSLATEFSCVDNYIMNGGQSQIMLGNLDSLVEYIAENEPDPEIHFHCYSFGSILAMDLLFPVAQIPPSDNIQKLTKLLITTGNPFEFINAYYPSFYDNRYPIMKDTLKWMNIYSTSDVFATNFRKDDKHGEAEFSIKDIELLPENINYEITSAKKGVFAFFSLNSIRMHKCYWDQNTIGQSCIKVLLPKMRNKNFI
ncbi:hypothetical protein OIU83_23140 [Flavobacterium sp. LS1R49]|uniref:Uncharacterized protein n=1 Tax=Flavobacterium shii TaxID=2987687 RepID=A0A9X2ZH34_9FLAO|nr:hypothetical protein [Flavobacterium shii]MCV9930575.1 hypothetical protein [Flavobacterium shii]